MATQKATSLRLIITAVVLLNLVCTSCARSQYGHVKGGSTVVTSARLTLTARQGSGRVGV